MGLLLGYDVGTSFVKAALINIHNGTVVATATSPREEMPIHSRQPGWAEQDPEMWWEQIKAATAEVKTRATAYKDDIKAIGISYQMHGLVLVEQTQRVLRPAILWCDNRALGIGELAGKDLGRERCLNKLMNLPGNFMASRLKWIQENEPGIFERVHKAMLPGDFIAMKLTDEISTTPQGLSEAILWDFQKRDLARFLVNFWQLSEDLIPNYIPPFSVHGEVTRRAADELGLEAGTPVSYKAGDQPSNALGLGAVNPGDVVAAAGTSGVLYGIADKVNYDWKARVNIFLHVNDTPEAPRYGVLACLNGAGILNRWVKQNFTENDEQSYSDMNECAAEIPVGSEGLAVLPYGNGAERTLRYKEIGASLHGLNFNVHTASHVDRAVQEGIVFALKYGANVMREMGVKISTVRTGKGSMFLSPLFREAFTTALGVRLELYDSDGAQGAARGAGVGAEIYKDIKESMVGLRVDQVIEPSRNLEGEYQKAYTHWTNALRNELGFEL